MNNMDNDDEQYNTIAQYSVAQYILHVTYNRRLCKYYARLLREMTSPGCAA